MKKIQLKSRVFNPEDQSSAAVIALAMFLMMIAYLLGAISDGASEDTKNILNIITLFLEFIAILIFFVFHVYWTDWKFVQAGLIGILGFKTLHIFFVLKKFKFMNPHFNN